MPLSNTVCYIIKFIKRHFCLFKKSLVMIKDYYMLIEIKKNRVSLRRIVWIISLILPVTTITVVKTMMSSWTLGTMVPVINIVFGGFIAKLGYSWLNSSTTVSAQLTEDLNVLSLGSQIGTIALGLVGIAWGVIMLVKNSRLVRADLEAAEKRRLAEVAENKRLADLEAAEKRRLAEVAENKRLADIEAQELRLYALMEQERFAAEQREFLLLEEEENNRKKVAEARIIASAKDKNITIEKARVIFNILRNKYFLFKNFHRSYRSPYIAVNDSETVKRVLEFKLNYFIAMKHFYNNKIAIKSLAVVRKDALSAKNILLMEELSIRDEYNAKLVEFCKNLESNLDLNIVSGLELDRIAFETKAKLYENIINAASADDQFFVANEFVFLTKQLSQCIASGDKYNIAVEDLSKMEYLVKGLDERLIERNKFFEKIDSLFFQKIGKKSN